MVLANQLIYLVNVKTTRKIFSNYVCLSKSSNFKLEFDQLYIPVKFWQEIVRFWFFLSYLITSDESEQSWVEPELELKDFQLGLARDLFPLSSKSKIGQKRADFFFLLFLVYIAKS